MKRRDDAPDPADAKARPRKKKAPHVWTELLNVFRSHGSLRISRGQITVTVERSGGRLRLHFDHQHAPDTPEDVIDSIAVAVHDGVTKSGGTVVADGEHWTWEPLLPS
jgi:hypothetical protein